MPARNWGVTQTYSLCHFCLLQRRSGRVLYLDAQYTQFQLSYRHACALTPTLWRENIHNGWNHKKAFLKFVEKEESQCSNISAVTSLFWFNMPTCLHFICLYNTANHTQQYTITKGKLMLSAIPDVHILHSCVWEIIKTAWHFLHTVWSEEWSSTRALSWVHFIALHTLERNRRINPNQNLFLSFSFPLSPPLNHTESTLVKWSYCTLQSS